MGSQLDEKHRSVGTQAEPAFHTIFETVLGIREAGDPACTLCRFLLQFSLPCARCACSAVLACNELLAFLTFQNEQLETNNDNTQ